MDAPERKKNAGRDDRRAYGDVGDATKNAPSGMRRSRTQTYGSEEFTRSEREGHRAQGP